MTFSPLSDLFYEPAARAFFRQPNPNSAILVTVCYLMRFRHVRLQAPEGSFSILDDFYGEQLGFKRTAQSGVMIGETGLVFEGGSGEPFYHFALLVPGNRFDKALEWIAERTEVLPDLETGEVVFDFDNWSALACYFHDPAGNIVELIAHRGVDETSTQGSFSAAEVVGFSELGLVGDRAEMAAALYSELGLEQWAGDLADEARLAFVGQKARTFILSSEGRGWLPTGRPAEAHPCDVELSETRSGEAHLRDSRYRITARAR
jgi:catechol 2,3-dioxygenase-like lactoylglutathione lyase family enzyme